MKKYMVSLFMGAMLLALPALSHANGFSVYSGAITKASAKFTYPDQTPSGFNQVSFNSKAATPKGAKNIGIKIQPLPGGYSLNGSSQWWAFARLDHCGVWLVSYSLIQDASGKMAGHAEVYVEHYADGADIDDNQDYIGTGRAFWYDAGCEFTLIPNSDGTKAVMKLNKIVPYYARISNIVNGSWSNDGFYAMATAISIPAIQLELQ